MWFSDVRKETQQQSGQVTYCLPSVKVDGTDGPSTRTIICYKICSLVVWSSVRADGFSLLKERPVLAAALRRVSSQSVTLQASKGERPFSFSSEGCIPAPVQRRLPRSKQTSRMDVWVGRKEFLYGIGKWDFHFFKGPTLHWFSDVFILDSGMEVLY